MGGYLIKEGKCVGIHEANKMGNCIRPEDPVLNLVQEAHGQLASTGSYYEDVGHLLRGC